MWPITSKLPLRFDLQLIRHFGIQKSFEYTASVVLDSKIFAVKNFGTNFALGNGISYVANPSFVIEGSNKVKPKKALYYFFLEENFYYSGWKNVNLSFRWHHRCHLLTALAPQGTGSNFFALGLRYKPPLR